MQCPSFISSLCVRHLLHICIPSYNEESWYDHLVRMTLLQNNKRLAGFHLEFFRWGGSSKESLVPGPFFLRAGRNASRGTFLCQKRGTGNEATPKLGISFGVSPHGQLTSTLNHISGMQILGGGELSSSCLGGGGGGGGGKLSTLGGKLPLRSPP